MFVLIIKKQGLLDTDAENLSFSFSFPFCRELQVSGGVFRGPTDISMALGEEKAEVETSEDTKAPSYRRWSCREQEVGTPGPVSGEQLPRLEAEGGPASPVWRAEGLPVTACCGGASPGPSGAYQPQASDASWEPGGSKPVFGCLLPPTSMGTGDLSHSVGSQVGTEVNGTVGLPSAVLLEHVPAFSHHLTCFPSPCTRWGIGRAWV